jgi:hypothetical protein
MKVDDLLHEVVGEALNKYIHKEFKNNKELQCALREAIRYQCEPENIRDRIKDYISYSDDFSDMVGELAREQLETLGVSIHVKS